MFNPEPVRVRRALSDDDTVGGCVIKPKYRVERLFPGWGPRLFAFAVAATIATLNAQPGAAQQLAQADCTTPDQPASVVETAQPNYPSIGWLPGDRSVVVQVDLTPSGSLAGASIAHSSGVFEFDREALRVAHASRYAPAIANCRATGGSFLYEVTFNG